MLEELLKAYKNGDVEIEHILNKLKDLPYENLDYARLDHHRKLRSGFAEVVFAQGKTPDQVAMIASRLFEQEKSFLATRATQAHFDAVKKMLPQAVYEERSGIITIKNKDLVAKGKVAICTGGTSDIPVAEEAAITAEMFGAEVIRIYDVGVAGIHRLLKVIPDIREANAIVAIAGMEGALPGVLAGLVDKPVIAVPTSVGYGTSFNGLSALLTMLNSCAEGIGVVNIDNGFGAGYLAAQINRLVVNALEK
ncbi:MAG: nickel pincer cofactor biosynthesis protein LarB [Proteocatella sp.]